MEQCIFIERTGFNMSELEQLVLIDIVKAFLSTIYFTLREI